LKSDVDFTHTKLQNLHPNLYWYISKSALILNSIKSTIDQPITPLAFFKKTPIVAAVRQGHTYLYPASTQMTKKETSTEEKEQVHFLNLTLTILIINYMS
jgi:hypothetical protein